MSDNTAPHGLLWSRLTLGALALMPLVAVFAPRFLGYGPGIIALGAALSYPFVFKARLTLSRPAFAITGSILALALLSASWAIDSGEVFERTGKLALILLPGALLISVMQACPRPLLARSVMILPVVLVAAMGFLTIELAFNAPFYHVTHGLPQGAHINMSVLNRSAVALLFLLLTVMGFVPFMMARAALWGRVVLGVLFLPIFLMTESQSVQLACVAGLLVLGLFPYRVKFFWGLLAALIVTYVMTMPWIAIGLFNHGVAIIDNLPFLGRGDGYAGARLEIWDFIARYIMKSPLHGFGIEATRLITDFDTQKIYHAGSTILHPHSMALQFWIEFGVIGALLASAILTYLVWVMATRFKPVLARIALPPFIAAMSVGSMSYGIWQGWWVGLLFLTAAFVIMAVRLREDVREEESPVDG